MLENLIDPTTRINETIPIIYQIYSDYKKKKGKR
jgi:hypothetical protein